jgi:enterochelin esterase-like enzyme
MQPKENKYLKVFGWLSLTAVCLCYFLIVYFSYHNRTYQEKEHDSRVFGQKRKFLLYLPESYTKSDKRYPVIYYFHGWGGRPWLDVNANLAYDSIQNLVNKYQLILVMADGSMDGIEPNPYNVGEPWEVRFSIQYKDYFPELVSYIDSNYRTLTDRGHRALMGFSMGGFISLFMGGIYADRICAVMSFAGSPEMMTGYPGNETLYPIRYTFKNLNDLDVRMHNGNTDILYYLNEEVHAGAGWEGKKIEYWTFHGPHMIDHHGETKVLEMGVKFISDAFHKQWPPPKKWSHYDIYPSFDLWGYHIESDKKEPGFIFLKNVDSTGFGIYTLRWLPDGPAIAPVSMRVVTAPVYKPGACYDMILYSSARDSLVTKSVCADSNGRISVEATGSGDQIGITDKNSLPQWVILDYTMDSGSHYLQTDRENKIHIRLLNRGGENELPARIRMVLSTGDSNIQITNPELEIKFEKGKRIVRTESFSILCNKKPPAHAEPPMVKFTLTEKNSAGNFMDDFTVPVLYDLPLFDSIRIDDGLTLRDSAFGKGNGNGVAEAGENILLYQGSHRLRIYAEDPWVPKDQERLAIEIIPARWPDGMSLSSVFHILPGCPDGHVISGIACYETKTFNPIERKLTWGSFRLTVRNKKQ